MYSLDYIYPVITFPTLPLPHMMNPSLSILRASFSPASLPVPDLCLKRSERRRNDWLCRFWVFACVSVALEVLVLGASCSNLPGGEGDELIWLF